MVALHTTAGCKVEDNSNYSGELVTKDCDINSPTQPGNQGCLFRAPSSMSYGNAFNSIGGGIYAAEWTTDSISVWFFPRYRIPSNINGEHPDPSSWARPIAHFTGCEFDKFFQEQRIVRVSKQSAVLSKSFFSPELTESYFLSADHQYRLLW